MAGGDLDTQELQSSGGPGWSGTRAGVTYPEHTGAQPSHFVVPGFTKTRWELPGLSHLVLEMSESLLFLKKLIN